MPRSFASLDNYDSSLLLALQESEELQLARANPKFEQYA